MTILNHIPGFSLKNEIARFLRPVVALIVAVVALSLSPSVGAATWIVTTLDASGPGSLKQVVVDAAPGDTITFAVSGQIVIPGTGLFIPKNLTIAGPGPNLLSISGGGDNTAMSVPTGVIATVSGITFLQSSNMCGDGGAIHVSGGNLTLVNSVVTGNLACAGGGLGTVNNGTTHLINSTIVDNNATIRGGAILNRTGGSTTIIGSLITRNSADSGSAIQVDDGSLTISHSCIIDNRGGIDVQRYSGTLTAENNWWGVPTGPNTGSETTNVAVTSFLTSPPLCGAALTVAVDVKPGSSPNSINPRSKGVIPVALLTTDSFDAGSVDPATIVFGEATPVHVVLEDVDEDGDLDLLLHIKTQDSGIVCGDSTAVLRGVTFGGQVIEGYDAIRTVGCK